MGTPHSGGNGVGLGKLVANVASVVMQTNSEYLNKLEQNSEWLHDRQKNYQGISNDFDTIFFYETLQTPILGGAGGTIHVCLFGALPLVYP